MRGRIFLVEDAAPLAFSSRALPQGPVSRDTLQTLVEAFAQELIPVMGGATDQSERDTEVITRPVARAKQLEGVVHGLYVRRPGSRTIYVNHTDIRQQLQDVQQRAAFEELLGKGVSADTVVRFLDGHETLHALVDMIRMRGIALDISEEHEEYLADMFGRVFALGDVALDARIARELGALSRALGVDIAYQLKKAPSTLEGLLAAFGVSIEVDTSKSAGELTALQRHLSTPPAVLSEEEALRVSVVRARAEEFLSALPTRTTEAENTPFAVATIIADALAMPSSLRAILEDALEEPGDAQLNRRILDFLAVSAGLAQSSAYARVLSAIADQLQEAVQGAPVPSRDAVQLAHTLVRVRGFSQGLMARTSVAVRTARVAASPRAQELKAYLRAQGLDRYPALAALFTPAVAAVLLDDPALAPVFVQVLPAGSSGDFKAANYAEINALRQLGAEELFASAVFSCGSPQVAEHLVRSGARVMVAITDREDPQAPMEFNRKAHGRQVFVPLSDGTWLGIKGAGQFVDSALPPYHHGPVAASEERKHWGIADLDEARSAGRYMRMLSREPGRFVRFVGVRRLYQFTDGSGNLVSARRLTDDDGMPVVPVQIVNHVLHPNRLSKMPQVLRADPLLARTRAAVSRALKSRGELSAQGPGGVLTLAQWMGMICDAFGRQEGSKQNQGLFKATLHAQDLTFAGEEADNEAGATFDAYREHLAAVRIHQRGPLMLRESELLEQYQLGIRGLLAKINLATYIFSNLAEAGALDQQQEEVLYPPHMLQRLFAAYFDTLTDEYLKVWQQHLPEIMAALKARSVDWSWFAEEDDPAAGEAAVASMLAHTIDETFARRAPQPQIRSVRALLKTANGRTRTVDVRVDETIERVASIAQEEGVSIAFVGGTARRMLFASARALPAASSDLDVVVMRTRTLRSGNEVRAFEKRMAQELPNIKLDMMNVEWDDEGFMHTLPRPYAVVQHTRSTTISRCLVYRDAQGAWVVDDELGDGAYIRDALEGVVRLTPPRDRFNQPVSLGISQIVRFVRLMLEYPDAQVDPASLRELRRAIASLTQDSLRDIRVSISAYVQTPSDEAISPALRALLNMFIYAQDPLEAAAMCARLGSKGVTLATLLNGMIDLEKLGVLAGQLKDPAQRHAAVLLERARAAGALRPVAAPSEAVKIEELAYAHYRRMRESVPAEYEFTLVRLIALDGGTRYAVQIVGPALARDNFAERTFLLEAGSDSRAAMEAFAYLSGYMNQGVLIESLIDRGEFSQAQQLVQECVAEALRAPGRRLSFETAQARAGAHESWGDIAAALIAYIEQELDNDAAYARLKAALGVVARKEFAPSGKSIEKVQEFVRSFGLQLSSMRVLGLAVGLEWSQGGGTPGPEEAASAAAGNNAQAVGGIDLRALPLKTQADGDSLALRGSVMDSASADKEWLQIESMVDGGIIPSSARLSELVAATARAKDPQALTRALGCIADILRLQEDQVRATDAPLRQCLAALEI
jgi:hypothetical protein